MATNKKKKPESSKPNAVQAPPEPQQTLTPQVTIHIPRGAELRKGRKQLTYKKGYCKKIKQLLAAGHNKARAAAFYGIPMATFYYWMKEHLDFQQAVLQGLDFYRAMEREDAIHKRCVGYRYSEPKREAIKYKDPETKEVLTERDMLGRPVMRITSVTTKEVPPDGDLALRVSAIRHPDRWSEKRRLEITGKNGAPLLAGGNGAAIDMQEIMRQIWAEANPALLPHQQPVYDPEFDGQSDTNESK